MIERLEFEMADIPSEAHAPIETPLEIDDSFWAQIDILKCVIGEGNVDGIDYGSLWCFCQSSNSRIILH